MATDDRILKLAQRGVRCESIARKIGRPGDLARIHEALARARFACICPDRDFIGSCPACGIEHGDYGMCETDGERRTRYSQMHERHRGKGR